MFSTPSEKAFLSHAGSVQPDPCWRLTAHSHPFHELVCVLRGRIHVVGNGQARVGAAGDVFLYPAGQAHEECSDPHAPLTSLFIAFTCPLNDASPITMAHDRRGRIAEMMRWLTEDAVAGQTSDYEQRHPLLPAILAEFEQALTAPPACAWLLRVQDYIQANISKPISLASLARVAGFSRHHFAHAYKDATSRTPMADVRAKRVQYARQLILGTAMPLKEVAAAAGFSDIYAFSRTFRSCLGVTPGSLRRNHPKRS